MSREFTVDAARLALEWLSANRSVWANAYAVTVCPNSYAVDQGGHLMVSSPKTVIKIQGNDLPLPGESSPWGPPDGHGFRNAVMVLSAELAVSFCTRLSSDTAKQPEQVAS